MLIPSKTESEAKPVRVQVLIPGEIAGEARRLAEEKGYGEDLGEFISAAAVAAIQADARKRERKPKAKAESKPEPKAEAKPAPPSPAQPTPKVEAAKPAVQPPAGPPAKEPEPVKTGLGKIFG